MREIKFRAKTENDGKWVYGYYLQQDSEDHFIYFNVGADIRKAIDPITLGQLTGLKDKNGKEIYEGDVVIWQDTSSNYPNIIHKKEVVHWGNIGWDGVSLIYKIEVIGNIHENPELVNL